MAGWLAEGERAPTRGGGRTFLSPCRLFTQLMVYAALSNRHRRTPAPLVTRVHTTRESPDQQDFSAALKGAALSVNVQVELFLLKPSDCLQESVFVLQDLIMLFSK
jgi:hypothetical protein